MKLSLGELYNYINFHNAKITYGKLVQNNLVLDVAVLNNENPMPIYMNMRLIFENVETLTDAYYSSKEKIISRFNKDYICNLAKISPKKELMIDDVLTIKFKDAEVQELA